MLNVYLAGEIHSNWREEIIQLCEKEKLDVKFTSPITDHEASDNCGVEILGAEEKNFWKDRKGANINSIRTKKSIQDCDVIIVKFGEKFKQWNAAFDAGYATALNKSMIVAALALPILKLIMVMLSAVAVGIALFSPTISTLCHSANLLRYSSKLVSKI